MTAGYLGVDIGLSGARATVISGRGSILAKSSVAKATSGLSPRQLGLLMDQAVRLALHDKQRIEIVALSVCAFGPAPIFLDQESDVLAMLPLFVDEAQSDQDQFADDLAKRIDQLSRSNPRLMKHTRFICDVTGYLVHHLTGKLVMDHVTAEDYLRLTLPRNVALPERQHALDRAGSLSAAASRRLGLPQGLPVAAGSYDSIADLAAAGFPKQAKAAIILGSTLVIGVHTPEQVMDPSLRSMPHLGKGWFSGGWTNCAGSSIALGKRLLAKPDQQRSASIPLLVPYFSGERAPVWCQQASGLLLGLRLDTTSTDLGDSFRQAVALSAADIAMRLQDECGKVKRWTVIGGGTLDSDLMQELSDALGARLDVPRGADAHLGPAILAAQLCGENIRFPVLRSFHARRVRHRWSRERLGVYRRVFDAMRPLMSDIARLTRRETQAR